MSRERASDDAVRRMSNMLMSFLWHGENVLMEVSSQVDKSRHVWLNESSLALLIESEPLGTISWAWGLGKGPISGRSRTCGGV